MLNERLRKLTHFGILRREAFPEVPPRVEDHLTEFGRRFEELQEQVAALEAEWQQSGPFRTSPQRPPES